MTKTIGSRYSRMEVYGLLRQTIHFKIFKGCVPQILLQYLYPINLPVIFFFLDWQEDTAAARN